MPSVKLFYGAYQFRPVPIFSETIEGLRDSKTDLLAVKHTLDFTGTLLVPSGNQSSFNEVYAEKERLKNALSSGNQQLVLLNLSNGPVITGVYPRVSNLQFNEGTWVDRVNYTFSLEYDENRYNTPVQSYSETWSFDESEDRMNATGSHQVSAVGLNTSISGVNNSFLNAKSFVLSKVGYNNIAPYFVAPSGSYAAYEGLRNESSDLGAGSFSITENYTLSSGVFIHTNTAQFGLDDAGVGTVSIDGSIQGLGRGQLAYQRAITGWTTSIRDRLPLFASGVYSELGGDAILRTANYKSFSITKNSFAGTLNYNVSYDDSDSNNLPSGIQDFTISVTDQKPVRLFASFPIMERTLGNVVQDISTSTEGRYEITCNAVGKTGFPFLSLLDYVREQVNNKRPFAINYETLRLENKQITKDESKNTINFGISWAYTLDLSSIQDGTGVITIN